MRTKYNVSANKNNRTFDGIVFDSAVEMRYYRDVVLPQHKSGNIVSYELQRKYELQPSFKYDGKTIRSINYIVDFYIEYKDGTSEVIDVKGMKTPEAQIKRKLFMYKYPNITLRWITYVNKSVGWLEYDEAQKVKNIRIKGWYNMELNKKIFITLGEAKGFIDTAIALIYGEQENYHPELADFAINYAIFAYYTDYPVSEKGVEDIYYDMYNTYSELLDELKNIQQVEDLIDTVWIIVDKRTQKEIRKNKITSYIEDILSQIENPDTAKILSEAIASVSEGSEVSE